MTIRNAYEFALIECNKLKAPSLLLEDYVYLFNKAIQQYVNSVYNRADYNQQSSDDLGWLYKVEVLYPEESVGIPFHGAVAIIKLPDDYLHLLNCKAHIITKSSNCKYASKSNVVNCTRLTPNLDGGICNNYYNKPSSKRPYYYITNRQDSFDAENPGYRSVLTYKDGNTYYFSDLKEKYDRTSHQSVQYIEIHLGESYDVVDSIQLTYLRSPMYVSMTQEELLTLEDTSQVLEFPDYVCYEIINIFVKLLMENSGDPRLSTNVPINQSIVTN